MVTEKYALKNCEEVCSVKGKLTKLTDYAPDSFHSEADALTSI
jgi:hypothetical protein